MKRFSFVSCALSALALAGVTAAPAFAQYKPIQISLSVIPNYFRGGCPVTLNLRTTFTLPSGTPSEAFSGGFFWVPLLPSVSLGNAFPELAVTGGTPTIDTIPVTITKTAAGWFLARVTTYSQYGGFVSHSNHGDFTVECIPGIAPGQSLSASPSNGAGSHAGYGPPAANTFHVPYPKSRPPYVPPSLHPEPPPPLTTAARTAPSSSVPPSPTIGPRPLANQRTGAANGIRLFSKIIAGRCAASHPTREYFSGAIYMNGKSQAALRYRWIRSDGASGPVISTIAVSSHQLNVRDEWDLRTANYSGWEAVQIISVDGAPTNIESNHASFVCSGKGSAARLR